MLSLRVNLSDMTSFCSGKKNQNKSQNDFIFNNFPPKRFFIHKLKVKLTYVNQNVFVYPNILYIICVLFLVLAFLAIFS